MSRRVLTPLAAFFSVIIAAEPALACPVCDSETAAQVRRIAFGPDFYWHVGATLAPVPALLVAWGAACYGARWLLRW